MADQVQGQETGGGEGVPAQPLVPTPSQEPAKPVDAPKAEEAKVEEPKVEVKPEAATQEIKPEAATQEVKPEAATQEIKPEAATQEVKPEAATQEVKPEEVKPEAATQEVKPEAATEVKQKELEAEVKIEAAKPEEAKPEEKSEVPEQRPEVATTKVVPEANDTKVDNATPEQQDWQQKETELLKKIAELETIKKERTEESLKFELKVREDEIELLKARVKNLETELQAALSKPSQGKNHDIILNLKQQHEELLSKARGMIFDKTKMVKNQELQIEALTTQVLSLKDINQITKDLLEIRNNEVKAMEERYQAMDARYKAEKERHSLVLQRAQNSSNINEDLRKEYETQLAIFKELRSKYEQRVQALNAENERLKASLEASNGSGPSA